MNYFPEDLQDPDMLVVRSRDVKRRDPFVYCRWAAGDWEAHFYANTDAHLKSRADTIKQLVNNPVWFKCKSKKLDKRTVTKNSKNQGKKTQSWIT